MSNSRFVARMFAVLSGIMRVRREAAENDFILQNLNTNFYFYFLYSEM